MILKELISELDYTLYNGNENVEITELVCDSRKIVKGCLFVCVRGTVFDGHTFIDEAIRQGAAAIMRKRWRLPKTGRILPLSQRRIAEIHLRWCRRHISATRQRSFSL